MPASWGRLSAPRSGGFVFRSTHRSGCREAADGTSVTASRGRGGKVPGVGPARDALGAPGPQGPRRLGREPGPRIRSLVGVCVGGWPRCAVGDTARGDARLAVLRGGPGARGRSLLAARPGGVALKVPGPTRPFCTFGTRGSERRPYGRTHGPDFPESVPRPAVRNSGPPMGGGGWYPGCWKVLVTLEWVGGCSRDFGFFFPL